MKVDIQPEGGRPRGGLGNQGPGQNNHFSDESALNKPFLTMGVGKKEGETIRHGLHRDMMGKGKLSAMHKPSKDKRGWKAKKNRRRRDQERCHVRKNLG